MGIIMKRLLPIFHLIILIIIMKFISSFFSNDSKKSAINPNMSIDQINFIEIIHKISNESDKAANDIGRKLLIERRNDELCKIKEQSIEGEIYIKDWIVKIKRIDANNSTAGIAIILNVANNINLINSAITDKNVIASLSTMRIGDVVKISGRLFDKYQVSRSDCRGINIQIKQGFFSKDTLGDIDLKEQLVEPWFGIQISDIKIIGN